MNTNLLDLNSLLAYLPKHEILYAESEQKNLLGLNFSVAGVAVKLEAGLEVTGSSSSTTDDSLIYAGYECLERYVVQTNKKDILESKNCRFSISNGVALHSSKETAQESAALELIERHEILKSWYHNTPIEILKDQETGLFPIEFINNYEVVVVNFSTNPQYKVIGIFAFPRQDSLNLIYGFACSKDLNQAILKARKEFITRLGFLWGEVSDLSGLERNSPLYHQDYYLNPQNIHHIREWLEGSQIPKMAVKPQIINPTFQDLTPQEWKNKLFIIKATSKDTIPLFFGNAPTEYLDFPYRCDIPHPIV